MRSPFNSFLTKILAEKQEEVDRLKKKGLPADRDMDLFPVRDFGCAISRSKGVNLIAEIKFASPSAGRIREEGDPLPFGRVYEQGGASAISVLTDEKFFGGNLDHVYRLKAGVSLPVLRKDFIIDEIQVIESYVCGADAILLIAHILSRKQLKELIDISQGLGLAALTEIHNREELERAIECGAEIIGINNRDLDTFEVDIATTIALAPLVPDRDIVVSESGIRNGQDIALLKKSGVAAALVGTSIMKSDDMEEKIRELVRAGRIEDGEGQDLRDNQSFRRPDGR